jgi:hypothetical protein
MLVVIESGKVRSTDRGIPRPHNQLKERRMFNGRNFRGERRSIQKQGGLSSLDLNTDLRVEDMTGGRRENLDEAEGTPIEYPRPCLTRGKQNRASRSLIRESLTTGDPLLRVRYSPDREIDEGPEFPDWPDRES